MRKSLAVLAVALAGLFGAASLGYAAYLVSRDSVGLPVTKLNVSPQKLAPPTARRKPAGRPKTGTVVTPPPPPATTVEPGDDHGGRSGRGGSGNSGHGRGGGGDDD
jgi:hypothetical protein